MFGATVELEDEDGKINVYQIVGDDEADIKQNRISICTEDVSTAVVTEEVDSIEPRGPQPYRQV